MNDTGYSRNHYGMSVRYVTYMPPVSSILIIDQDWKKEKQKIRKKLFEGKINDFVLLSAEQSRVGYGRVGQGRVG